ncbi:hypothetical protein MRQ36_02190 [Micromonospora sp. R77]|uniref:hypothetical protein n=1 Tax=Micromonospora sp. R77 TaxID=2925836 RepID=UPI001F60FDF0|nr:hypothetical protein [Micromonospora sp. R77]MCI4061448.1 hypothetical protein [Micromonospora sp. R77]
MTTPEPVDPRRGSQVNPRNPNRPTDLSGMGLSIAGTAASVPQLTATGAFVAAGGHDLRGG